MNLNLVVLFSAATTIVIVGCVTSIVMTWLKTRARVGESRGLNERLSQVLERLEHLDNSVDTVALEVERISEAQRFTTKLLAERAPAPALAERGRAEANANVR